MWMLADTGVCCMLNVTLYSIDDYHCKVPKQVLTGMHLVFQ